MDGAGDVVGWLLANWKRPEVLIPLAGLGVDIWWRRCTPDDWSQWWTAVLGIGLGVLGAWMMPEARAAGFALGLVGFGFGILWGGFLLAVAPEIGRRWLGLSVGPPGPKGGAS